MALLQEPELLILDEPTVGVDPLLRQTIWRHLIKISGTTTTTIIITTHYVEEARQANRVGFKRFYFKVIIRIKTGRDYISHNIFKMK